MTKVPSTRPNHITVYCDGPDLKYAEDFLSYYGDRLLKTDYNGQWLTVQFDTSGLLFIDAVLLLDGIKEALSRCIRRHRKLSTPPPGFPEKT